MPSRRSILAASGLAAGAALAGCSVRVSPGTDAAIRGNVPDVPTVEEAPLVARAGDETPGSGCPEGLVRAEARVHEVERGDEPDFVLVTEYQVITGESQCSTGWGKTGVEARHDWRTDRFPADAAVTDHRSNVVPTGEASEAAATLQERHTRGRGDWRVHLTPPNRSSGSYAFASTLVGAGDPATGDVLAETRATTNVRRGWLGGRDELETGTALTYGDTGR